ncbi:hypothetical protein [Tropicimonas isoalkanivorans]|uniref:Tat (Twin-arginine translocation) pathway signal sequence n=1 Tax=Tropicimonas isoalkanivorans TaxID=441112 RepID=A0A1I1JZ80_9RHOB|nr:hypothetical protein [Tropicimonas isoalkanivorans]SFC50680.1 hypothetical protein SAMN04488094_105220 [Tropicimonas isoalkanivorans]
MKRRDVLSACAAATVLSAAGPLRADAPSGAAAEIGRWLLAHGVLPRNPTRLREGLPESRSSTALQTAMREDFAALRIVSVNDWYISETEARLCALAALGMPESGVL